MFTVAGNDKRLDQRVNAVPNGHSNNNITNDRMFECLIPRDGITMIVNAQL
jgi:hypothetical protein